MCPYLALFQKVRLRTLLSNSPNDLSSAFLAIILQLPIPKTRSYPGRLVSQNLTQFYAAPASFETLLYNHFAWTMQKTQPLYYWEGMCTASLHSNKSYLIVAHIFVAEGMC
jgi:hypothetical protein